MRFAPGFSGNPSGRPKSNLSKLLSAYMLKKVKGRKETYGELLVARLLKLAIEGGDLDAIKYCWDRLEGKVPDSESLPEGRPIFASFVQVLQESARERNLISCKSRT